MCFTEGELPMRRISGDVGITNLIGWAGIRFSARLHLIVLKVGLKGECREIFCFWFFSWIIFPHASDNSIRVILNFLENSRRYLQVKVHHRYQWHPRQVCHRCQRHLWQIVGTLSDCWHLKVNLKKRIYLYMLTLLLKGVQKFFFKCSGWRFIWFATGVVDTRGWCTLSCEYLREFSKTNSKLA